MARPELVVEFAPGFTPFDESPVWVAAQVISVEYQDGRTKDLTAYPPGTATVVLPNKDRRYDPEYEAGPYAGQLVPRVPFRIRAVTPGPTSKTLFYGFVEGGWEQDWRPPGDMVCKVTLVDWLGVIASYRLDDYLDDFVLAHDVTAWWRFDETRNTTEVVDRSGNDHHGTATGCVQGEAGLTPGAGRSVFVPRANDPITAAVVDFPVVPSVILEPPFTVCFVSRVKPVLDTTAAQHYLLLQLNGADLSGFVIGFLSYFNVDGAGTGTTEHGMLTAYQRDNTARREIVRSESGFDDDVARFYAVVVPTWDASDWTIRFSNDGSGTSQSATVLTSNNGGSPPTSTPDLLNVGNWDGAAPGADYGLNGYVDHLILIDGALSQAEIDVLNEAIWDYNGGQTTGAGVDWVLDRIGVPAAFRDIDAGDEMLGVSTEFGALERLRGYEAVERGALYVDHAADGVIRFRSASNLAADTRVSTSQHTLSDEDTPGVFHYERSGLKIQANGVSSIVNRQTVEWAGGTVTVQDDASVDAYGPREGPVLAAPAEDYTAAKTIAQAMVSVGKEPKTEVQSLRFDAGANDANFDLLLDLQPRDRLTLERRPLGLGDPIVQDVYYQGGRYRIGPGLHWDGQLFVSSVPVSRGTGSSVSASSGSATSGVTVTLVGMAADAATGAAPSLTAPTRQVGDLLSAVLVPGNAGSPPAGWTQRANVSGKTHLSRLADNTATDNVAGAADTHSGGGLFAFRFVGGSTFVWGAGVLMNSTPPATVTVPSATALGPGVELIVAAYVTEDPVAGTISTPAGFTLLGTTTDVSSGSAVRIAAFSRPVAAAGPVGTTGLSYAAAGSTGWNGMACKILVS